MRWVHALLAVGLFQPVATVNAAEITHWKHPVDGSVRIEIDGPIEAGDDERFRRISLQFRDAVVNLDSEGGALLPALEIGKMIRVAGYDTMVRFGSSCASSCALIWLAGERRKLSVGGKVGFHAAYRNNSGRPEEIGAANALIGNYLTLLGFSTRASLFVTSAPPTGMRWLTEANKEDAGIDFWSTNEPPLIRVTSTPTPPQITPPPIQTTQEPIADPEASPKLEFGPTAPSDWLYLAKSASGTVYYYNIDSIRRNESFVEMWVKEDHSLDRTISHRTSMDLLRIRCNDRSIKVSQVTYYDNNGIAISSDVDEGDRGLYTRIVPDSIWHAIWETVC